MAVSKEEVCFMIQDSPSLYRALAQLVYYSEYCNFILRHIIHPWTLIATHQM